MLAQTLRLAAMVLLMQALQPAAAQPLFERLPQPIKDSKTVKLVGDAFAPYRMVGEDGKTVTGIDTDLARALEPLLGVKFEQTTVSNLPAMLAGIDTARYDLTTGPLLSTKAREERYDIITWIVSKPAFIVPTAGGKKVAKLLDLCGLRISFPAGSAQEPVAKQVSERCVADGQQPLTLIGLADQNATVLAAQSGRADIAGMQYAAALHLQKANPGKFHVQTDETDALGILHQGFVMKKGAPLAPVLLEALKQLWASGEYKRIMDKWGLGPAMAAEPRLNPSSGAK